MERCKRGNHSELLETTSIIPAQDTLDPVQATDNRDEDIAALERYIEITVPIATHHIPVDEILNRDGVIECTKVYYDDDMVDIIRSADSKQ